MRASNLGPGFNLATGCVQGVSVPRPLGSQKRHGDTRPLPKAAFNQENICLLPRTHCQVLVQHGKRSTVRTHARAASYLQPPIMVVYQSGTPGPWRPVQSVTAQDRPLGTGWFFTLKGEAPAQSSQVSEMCLPAGD